MKSYCGKTRSCLGFNIQTEKPETPGRGKAELWLMPWSEMVIGESTDAIKVMHLHTKRRWNKCLWITVTLHCQRHHEIQSFSSDDRVGYTILCAVTCHCRRWDLKLCRWVCPGAYSYLLSLVNKMDGNTGIHPCNKYMCIANNGTENTQLQAENNISCRYLKSIIKKLREINAL